MHLRFAYIVMALALFGSLPRNCVGEDPVDDLFQTLRIVEIMDAVLDHHVEPPAKQQMILAGVRALYDKREKIPTDLSRQVSQLNSSEEIVEFLEARRKELVAPENEANQLSRFIQGMFSCVPGRPTLLSGKEANVQSQLEANRYVGIGISLTQNSDGMPKIAKSMYGGSGYKAGVLTGDIILEVDGEPTKGSTLNEVVQRLRGDEGTVVKLVLKQPNGEPRTLDVERRVTFIPTIEGIRESAPGQWNYSFDFAPNVVILRLQQIGPSTAHELKKIETQLRGQELSGVVLDLRDASGTLHDLLTFADQLLDAVIIGSLRNADGIVVHTMQPGSLWKDVPILVLVDRTTGAGPIYLAAALQDAKRARICGEMPMVNAYAQSRVLLSDGSSLQLASGTLHRANGHALIHSFFDPSSMEANASPSDGSNFINPDFPFSEQGKSVSNSSDEWIRKAAEILSAKPKPHETN